MVDVASVEKQIDLIQYRLRRLREAYDAQFPGVRDSQTRISDAERELRDAQALLKKLKTQPKPVTPNLPVSFQQGAL